MADQKHYTDLQPSLKPLSCEISCTNTENERSQQNVVFLKFSHVLKIAFNNYNRNMSEDTLKSFQWTLKLYWCSKLDAAYTHSKTNLSHFIKLHKKNYLFTVCVDRAQQPSVQMLVVLNATIPASTLKMRRNGHSVDTVEFVRKAYYCA